MDRQAQYSPPPMAKKFSGKIYKFVKTFNKHEDAREYLVENFDPEQVKWRIWNRPVHGTSGLEFSLYIRERNDPDIYA